MSLSVGTRLGPYEVTGAIGAGGMGEVYRATDTKLGREVAIKALPGTLASDSDRLARFDREAKLLAALNHPNIAVIYGLEEHDGTQCIAMELIEGETLEDRLKVGPLPIEDALQIALQIALGLEAAHEKGVVHRDLKPANVMITAKGQVKVLDFGLAKAFTEDADDAGLGQSPALSLAMTQQGIILGTAGYMSPEQASGQATDQRADVWAFGVVLFEMLSGLPLFKGESVPHVLADVLKTEPDWNKLPTSLHPRLRLMLERCLAKKPRSRYHAIADARIDIEAVLNDPAGSNPAVVSPSAASDRSLVARFAIAGIPPIVVGALVGLAAWLLMQPEPQPVSRFDYELPDGLNFRNSGRPVVAISMDGRRFAYNTTEGLYLRSMDELEAQLISGTEPTLTAPAFSPDGQALAYWDLDSRQIKRISVNGGASVRIADDATNVNGLRWEPNGTILYGQPEGIFSVSVAGGIPDLIVAAEEGEILYGPSLLPDGQGVLFSATLGEDWDTGQIIVQSLATGERAVLVEGGNDARYLPSGHLVYAFEAELFAIAFDVDTLTTSGIAVPLVQGVRRANTGQTGVAHYSVSANGTLVYVSGSDVVGSTILQWTDLDGRDSDIDVFPTGVRWPRVSPDGRWLAFGIVDAPGSPDVWIYDVERGILTRLTFHDGRDDFPLWTPDSEAIVFFSDRDGGGLFRQAADGTGSAERLTTRVGTQEHRPVSFLADGSELIYFTQGGAGTVAGGGSSDLYALSMDREPTARLLLESDADEDGADVSPNGRWIAYVSDESGRDEVYLRPYPDIQSGRWQVSRDGGRDVQWRPDGQALFYREGYSLMTVSVETEPEIVIGSPEPLFSRDFATAVTMGSYDVAPDGQRILVNRLGVSATDLTQEIVIVENWFEEVERLVPTGR